MPTLGPRILGRDEPEQLLERGHLEPPVEGGAAQLGQPLARAQRLELGEREVLGEPAADRSTVDRLRRPASRELRVARDVGRPGDLVLVAADEDAVLRGHQVRLDEVGALLDRDAVGLERVLGPLAARAAVGDHDRTFAASRHAHAGQQQAGRSHGRSCHPHEAKPSSLSRRAPSRRRARRSRVNSRPGKGKDGARPLAPADALLCGSRGSRGRAGARAGARADALAPAAGARPFRRRRARDRARRGAAGARGSRAARWTRSPATAWARSWAASTRRARPRPSSRRSCARSTGPRSSAADPTAARCPWSAGTTATPTGSGVDFDWKRARLPAGLVPEHRVNGFLIRNLSPAGYATSGDFDRLPIPFRAVAYDLGNGDRVILAKGRPCARGAREHVDPGLLPARELGGPQARGRPRRRQPARRTSRSCSAPP